MKSQKKFWCILPSSLTLVLFGPSLTRNPPLNSYYYVIPYPLGLTCNISLFSSAHYRIKLICETVLAVLQGQQDVFVFKNLFKRQKNFNIFIYILEYFFTHNLSKFPNVKKSNYAHMKSKSTNWNCTPPKNKSLN